MSPAAPPVVSPPPKLAAPAPKPDVPPPAAKTGKLTVMPLETFFPRQQAGSALIYDARPGFVAAFGKIPGAISWPRGDFEKQIAQREPEIRQAAAAGKVVVIYCTDLACPDARAIAEKLAARGHDVSILEGGYATWKEAGMTVE